MFLDYVQYCSKKAVTLYVITHHSAKMKSATLLAAIIKLIPSTQKMPT